MPGTAVLKPTAAGPGWFGLQVPSGDWFASRRICPRNFAASVIPAASSKTITFPRLVSASANGQGLKLRELPVRSVRVTAGKPTPPVLSRPLSGRYIRYTTKTTRLPPALREFGDPGFPAAIVTV